MNEDITKSVIVFSTNNNAEFQVAKSILQDNRIKFFSNGEYLNTLNSAVYSAEITVSEKEANAARKLLSKLSTQYQPPTKSEKKIMYLVLGIIFLCIIAMIVSFYLFKK